MSNKSDEIRTFIAIDLPDTVKSFLKETAHELKGFGAHVRWVRPESIHLTLKFLGNVNRDLVPTLEAELNSILSRERSFPLSMSGLGAFPGLKRPRVIWAGLDDPGRRLTPLVAGIDDRLEPLGFKKEKRPFRPHLTLGRVKSPRGVGELVAAVRRMMDVSGPSFTAEKAFLFQSVLKPSGAEYTPLARFEFPGAGES